MQVLSLIHIFAFAEEYRRFISGCKTERECTAAVYADATGHGFVDLDELSETGKSVKAGDKIIANNMGKGLALFIAVSYTHLDVYKRQGV